MSEQLTCTTTLAQIIDLLHRDRISLWQVPEQFRKLPEVVFIALGNDRRDIRFVPPELKTNGDFVIEAFKRFPYIFSKNIPENLRSDEKFILRLCFLNYDYIQYASEELKADKKLLLEIIKQSPNIDYSKTFIEHISNELKGDEELVLAILNKGLQSAIYHVSPTLKADEEFMLLLCSQSPFFGRFISSELKSNKRFIKKIVKMNPINLWVASEEINNDKSFILELLLLKIDIFPWILDHYKDDEEIVVVAIEVQEFIFKNRSYYIGDTSDLIPTSTSLRIKTLFNATIKLTGFQLIERINQNRLPNINLFGKTIAKLMSLEEYKIVYEDFLQKISSMKAGFASFYHGPRRPDGFTDIDALRALGQRLSRIRFLTNAYGLTSIRQRLVRYLVPSNRDIRLFMQSFLSIKR